MNEKFKKVLDGLLYVLGAILFVLFLIAMLTIVPFLILDWMW